MGSFPWEVLVNDVGEFGAVVSIILIINCWVEIFLTGLVALTTTS